MGAQMSTAGADQIVQEGDPTRILGYVVEPLALPERDPAPPLPGTPLVAEPVPSVERHRPAPIIRVLMPVIMVVVVLAMVALMVMSSGMINPMILIFPLMMGLSMMMMFTPQDGDDIDETRRTYLRHLGALREEALAHARAQRNHEWHRHPAPDLLWSQLGSRRMWERAREDPDVLEVRLGLGVTSLNPAIKVSETGAPEDLDPVCAVSLRRTMRAVGSVADMPVVVQLQAFRFLGLSGPGAQDLARALVVQLLFHHGPETVGVQVRGVAGNWEWLKWVPHARAPERAVHRVLILDSELTTGTESFIDDPAWTCIINVGALGTTALGQRAEQEGLVIHVDEQLSVFTAQGPEHLGAPDRVGEEGATVFARMLTGYRRSAGAGAGTSGELLPLLGIADVEQLTPDRMWPVKRRSPRTRLSVPLGLTESGAPMLLDLKESAQGGMGPHGLCIGATGSGNNECGLWVR
ncbi:cell division protein FtsK [Corynebacterium pacaense]|uniref:cell division protein FtsK n=1 Tax=Corynebacterium pacaense TaxID=1816684 RepID=UPI001FE48AC7|nr:cell division protein FtsK [Corynebacterium pacaense]